MKTQITVKRRITAILMIITLMLPIFNAPAFSTAGRPGELANFEMKVDNAGANVLGTIIYIPGWNPDSHSNPMDESLNALESFIYINPVNVTQYIDGGTTSSLSTYYWTASSGDPSIATVAVEPDASNPNAENRLVFKGHKFGTVVITVNMSAVSDMSAVVTKTFTVRIVDASKHGTAEASFLKDGSSVDTEKIFDVKINAPVTLTIDKLLGNDYSDLSSSVNYKNISNYKWTASVSNSDVIKLNANSTEISTQTINSDAPAEGSTKDIVITPVSEGDAAITVYFEPLGAMSAVFGPFSCVIQMRVTKSVGNLDFTITPGKKAYLAESAYEKIKDPYAPTEPISVDGDKDNDNDNNDTDDSGLGLTFKSQIAFASGSTFEPDLDSDVDVMFQKPTEPPVPAPTEPYDLDSDVDIMYQNKNTNNSNNNNSNNNSSNNTNSNNTNNNSNRGNSNNNSNNNNNSNFEPDLDSDVDIMFQKPTEPPVPAPTEPYDLDSDVDIMFQNKNNNNNNNNTNNNNSNNNSNSGNSNNNSNNNNNSNFEPDLDSDVDIMFQKPTEPPAEAPTEPYDLDSDVDIMFQNKNNNNNNNNSNNTNNNSNNNNNLYGDANGIPGAGLNPSYPVSPNLPLPGGDTSVSLTVDNFKALVNGEWEDTADMASAFFENSSDSSNFEITGYSYSYPAKITGEISNTGNTVIERRATDEQLALANKEQQIIIDIDNIVLQENFTVTVTVTSEIYKVTQSKAKTFQVTYINSDVDGSISAITVKQDREIDVNEGQTVIAKIDKEGKGEDILIDVTRLDIVDFSGGFEEYIKTVSANSEAFAEYRFSITSSNTSVVRIGSNVSSGVTLTPLKPGNVTITVQIKDKNNLNTLYTGKFNVSVTNIGVFSDEEGVLKSVTLNYGKETVYADYTLYMKAGSEMKIDIAKVMELSASAKSSDGYARELKTYKWEAVSTNAEIVEVRLSTPQIGSISVGADSHEDLKSFSLLSYANSFGTSTIKVTVTSAREDIEDIKEYSVTFKIIVNALGGKFMPVVQYDTETVKIALDVHEDSSGINYSYYEFDMSNSSGVPAPEYMYCLKAASDGASQTSEKWYPFMGSEMDISTLVPKGGSTPYRLAIREVDAVKLEDGNYSSADRHVALLYPRKTLSSAEKKAIVYRDGKIMLNSAGADPIDIYYKVELSGWLKGTISGTDGISFPGEIAPTGSVVQIKYASTLDYETNKYEFSSAIVKVKIPKAAKKPNIKINDKTGSYSGFTGKMEYTLTSPLAVGENGNSMTQNSPGMWTDCPKGTASYRDLNNKFPNLANAPVDANGNVTLYIRTKATIKNDGSIKTPASEIVAMKIPADIFG